jgi:glycosyltransferase involved in cell wall biosynthesis
MNNTPLVSVIVPCFNHESYILSCIESIVNQTFKSFELIVIDDGSKDGSPEILKELQAKYNFTLVLQENIGVSSTLNKALKEFAKGKYVSICASDDYWSLNKLELQVDFMENHLDIPMCYGKIYYIGEESKIIEKYDSQNNVLKGGDIFNDIFTFKLHPPVNYMYRTEIFNEIGFFDATICAEDYYMNLKIASKFNIGFIEEYLGYYRVDSSIKKVIRFDKVSDSHLMSIEEYKDHPYYHIAKTTVFLRKFLFFAAYKEYKKIAMINCFKSFSFFYKLDFIKATAKLIIFWR